jgi:hypothetical protein
MFAIYDVVKYERKTGWIKYVDQDTATVLFPNYKFYRIIDLCNLKISKKVPKYIAKSIQDSKKKNALDFRSIDWSLYDCVKNKHNKTNGFITGIFKNEELNTMLAVSQPSLRRTTVLPSSNFDFIQCTKKLKVYIEQHKNMFKN